ncbi:MAG: adenylate/guanylate cyclase domain-containing protein [Cyanobacteria bacterium P01_D01_bin.36]
MSAMKPRVMNSLGHFFWQWRAVLFATPSVTVLVVLLRFVGLFQGWEWAAFDQYMRLRPAEPADSRVVIVGLNEGDLAELGSAVVADQVYADVLEELRSHSPRAIGLDVYRDLPVEPGYEALAEIFDTTPQLVGIQKVVGEAGFDQVAPPPVLAAKGQVGANDVVVDADNTVRRGLISVQDEQGNTVYSLSLYLALLYLEGEGVSPQMLDEQTWQLGESTFSPFTSHDGGYVRADAAGYQQLINYRGPQRIFETVSFSEVLNGELPEDWARDRVVLIGAVSESFNDTFYTPYRGSLLSLPRKTAGVEIHANLTSQFISAALDNRAVIRSWSEPVEWLWIFGWAGVGSMLVWLCSPTGPQLKYRWQRGGMIAIAAITLFGGTFLPFLYGWWLPIVPAFLSTVGAATVVTTYLAYTASDIRRTFGRYLSDEIVTALLENPEGQKLGGERREITILTSDLRGFTATSERLPPETVIKVLNFYLGHMADVITRYNGTIDEFMGDGILILFGAPVRREDDAERAVACAVDMQLAMTAVNETIESWDLAPLEMGIGIHTGEVVVGNIGSEKRTKYGIVGSPVNLTYRIESFTTGGQILISTETLSAAGSMVKIGGEQQVKPKGVAAPITIYDVQGVGTPYNLALIKEEENFFPLKQSIPILFNVLEGKSVNDALLTGQLTELSEKGALLQLSAGVPVAFGALNNLKLNFLQADSSGVESVSDDIYAKVIEQREQTGQSIFQLRFTAKSPAIAAQLRQLYQSISVVTS